MPVTMTEISYQRNGYPAQYSSGGQRQHNLLPAGYSGYPNGGGGQPGYDHNNMTGIGGGGGGGGGVGPGIGNGPGAAPMANGGSGPVGGVRQPNGFGGTPNGQPIDPTDLVLRPGPAPTHTTGHQRTDSQNSAAADRRPSSAPGAAGVSKPPVTLIVSGAQDESDDENPASGGAVAAMTLGRRPVKPLLLRSKSEHGVQTTNANSSSLSVGNANHSEVSEDDGASESGARHGFEDDYNRKEVISYLINVCGVAFLFIQLLFSCFVADLEVAPACGQTANASRSKSSLTAGSIKVRSKSHAWTTPL